MTIKKDRRLPLLVWLLVMVGPLFSCAAISTRPEPPNISLVDLRPLDVGLFEQRYRLRLRIQNPNPFALPIRGMDYVLHLNDREFGYGVSPEAATVPAFGERVIEVDVVSNLARAFDQLVELGAVGGLRYRLSGGLRLKNVAARVPFEYQGEISLAR